MKRTTLSAESTTTHDNAHEGKRALDFERAHITHIANYMQFGVGKAHGEKSCRRYLQKEFTLASRAES